MTYPLIGNYGMAADDYETPIPTIGAMIVRDHNDAPSNFRSERTLAQVMEQYHISGISGIDTRRLARSIRDKGSRRCLITAADTSLETGLERLRSANTVRDAVSRVSCGRVWQSMSAEHRLHVVAIDCGIKRNIVRSLNERGCDVTVVPWNTPVEHIEELRPDGVFLSNGPGDPTDVQPVIDTIRRLRGKYPMFGICLGHQLLALAYGAETYKLKFGHRGGNHPVKDSADREDQDHLSKSLLRRQSRQSAEYAPELHPYQSAGWHSRGAGMCGRPGIQRAVSSGKCSRSPG